MEFVCCEVEIVFQIEVGLSSRSIKDRREVLSDQSGFRLWTSKTVVIVSELHTAPPDFRGDAPEHLV